MCCSSFCDRSIHAMLSGSMRRLDTTCEKPSSFSNMLLLIRMQFVLYFPSSSFSIFRFKAFGLGVSDSSSKRLFQKYSYKISLSFNSLDALKPEITVTSRNEKSKYVIIFPLLSMEHRGSILSRFPL